MNAALTVGQLGSDRLRRSLAEGSFRFHSGPLTLAISSPDSRVATAFEILYADHALAPSDAFADFHVELKRADSLRGWIKPQVVFEFDGERPFQPLPLPQSFALLEWGINWCIANHCHQYLMIHAAALERNGRAVILPAPPGSGKSTLCASLALRNWRLLSDEMSLIAPKTGEIQALARPINLKNSSIDLIRAWAPDAMFGPIVPDTKKGTIAHVRPPIAAVQRMHEPAKPRYVIFPRYVAGSPSILKPIPRHQAFIELADNAFNYHVLGLDGFKLLASVLDDCECMSFTYSKLDDAITAFDRLANAE